MISLSFGQNSLLKARKVTGILTKSEWNYFLILLVIIWLISKPDLTLYDAEMTVGDLGSRLPFDYFYMYSSENERRTD